MYEIVFFASIFVLFYIYIGYPVLLIVLSRIFVLAERSAADSEPTISLIIPVFNEKKVIQRKILNTLSLDYPSNKFDIIFVSDASNDGTNEIIEEHSNGRIRFLVLPERQGKAAALNRGLEEAALELVVFSDASIMLRPDALRNIVRGFSSQRIGCISGEDHILGGGGESIYGRYELFLRNLESRVGSIVGASGCFYAQRRALCEPFREGMAPDFFSVLTTVDKGFLAVAEPLAIGTMDSLEAMPKEFRRKVRTLVRGITALMGFKHLLNPFRYGMFSVQLVSHKIMRWLAWAFLMLMLLSNLHLLDDLIYRSIFVIQICFYSLASIGIIIAPKKAAQTLVLRVPAYFCMVNYSALVAWIKYFTGFRQEIWEPSRRLGE